MASKYIKVRNAKENNLKGIDINIPKEKLVVITGVSGSGKSSLAFDVLYSEGRRRYVDSLSNYARQFLGGTSKPNVDSIEGLSPAIAINQKTTSNNPRSTVGTITEIYDFYRLLFARVGKPFCPNHNIEISARPISDIVDQILKENNNQNIMILSPIVVGQKGSHEDQIEKLRKDGFVRVMINDKVSKLEDNIDKLDKNKKHDISIVVDRIRISKAERSRIFEAVQVASEYSNGTILINNTTNETKDIFSLKLSCKYGDFSISEIEPRLFSFNSPFGACDLCKGLGQEQVASWNKLINKGQSIIDGGIKFFNKASQILWQKMEALMKEYNIDALKPVEELSEREVNIIMNGSDREITYDQTVSGVKYKKTEFIEGLGKLIERRLQSTQSEAARNFYISFLTESKCSKCNGNKLRPETLSVKINQLNIMQLSSKSIIDSYDWFVGLTLTSQENEIAKLVISEIISRFEFLINVGLGYLTLDRIAKTLSGGESQRIRLASQLGSKLTGILYVLDEPSIGLHQRDNMKLINSLKSIRDLGNTVIVVEHDEETMMEADYLIDIGPKAGQFGGTISSEGTPEQVVESDSLTGKYLSGREYIPVPKKRRPGNGRKLKVIGARQNNLQNIDVTFPLGMMVGISGVSGSGKSTLVNEILYKSLWNSITKHGDKFIPGDHDKIEGIESIDKVVQITQDPIGKTPRSNPATYTSSFDNIRDLFSQTHEAKLKGFEKGRFSFNVKGGRCDKCEGDGVIKIPMHFLPDVNVVCDLCDGKRYNEETLLIKYKGKTISDVLAMSVDESVVFFEKIPKLYSKLKLLQEVGLGYLTLGHPSTVLSGGESQRIKLATHLQKKPTGKTLYILDEPTTGLHDDDINKLMEVLNKMVDKGDSMIIIEHNLDVLKSVDYIIDMGPEGGDKGGKAIAKGKPEEISGSKVSVTGPYLKDKLNKFK